MEKKKLDYESPKTEVIEFGTEDLIMTDVVSTSVPPIIPIIPPNDGNWEIGGWT